MARKLDPPEAGNIRWRMSRDAPLAENLGVSMILSIIGPMPVSSWGSPTIPRWPPSSSTSRPLPEWATPAS